jgi:hypothetical protein
MSVKGQKRTLNHVHPMSALLLKADIAERDHHVRFVPQADMAPDLTAATNEKPRHFGRGFIWIRGVQSGSDNRSLPPPAPAEQT